jgi:hypothetical protein
MTKLAAFFIAIVFSCSLMIGIADNAFAQAMAMSAKMIKLKQAQKNDLVLCATNKVRLPEKNQPPVIVEISLAIIVDKNVKESLVGVVFINHISIDGNVVKHEELAKCESVLIIERRKIDEVATIISNFLYYGLPLSLPLPLTMEGNWQSQPLKPAPEPSSPTTPTPRRSYF